MRDRLKSRLRGPLARLLGLRARWSDRRVGLALVYHRIGERQQSREGHLVPALGTRRFERELRWLRRRYDLVPASELMAAVRGRERGQPLPVAITFDDDLPSHLRTAMPVLRRLGAPATFFLCGASLDRPRSYWWERLQRAFDSGLVAGGELDDVIPVVGSISGPADIRRVARAIEAAPRAEREAISLGLRERLGPDPPEAGLRASQVRELAAAGLEIGFHTRGHDVLTALDDADLAGAMREGRVALAEAAGADRSIIAYPHGRADGRVSAAARGAGFRFGFTVEGGPVQEDADPMLVPRFYPEGDEIGRFALQLARTALSSARSPRG